MNYVHVEVEKNIRTVTENNYLKIRIKKLETGTKKVPVFLLKPKISSILVYSFKTNCYLHNVFRMKSILITFVEKIQY